MDCSYSHINIIKHGPELSHLLCEVLPEEKSRPGTAGGEVGLLGRLGRDVTTLGADAETEGKRDKGEDKVIIRKYLFFTRLLMRQHSITAGYTDRH